MFWTNIKKIIGYEVRVHATSENDLYGTYFRVHGNRCFTPYLKMETNVLVLISKILFFYGSLLEINVPSKNPSAKLFS